MAPFHIDIATGATTPIYRQIVDQVRLGVATGALAPGDALLSVRAQAERLGINPNTVARAYADLVRDGVLESHQGRGVLVAHKKRQVYSRAERLRRLQLALDAFIHEAVFLDFTPAEVRKAVDEKLADLDSRSNAAGEKP